MSIVPFYWGGSNLNYQRGLLSLFSLCSEVRITPHHENGLLHLHLVWCSILSSETAETLAAARVSGVASFLATLVGAAIRIRTADLILTKYLSVVLSCCHLMWLITANPLYINALYRFSVAACSSLSLLGTHCFFMSVWVLYGFLMRLIP